MKNTQKHQRSADAKTASDSPKTAWVCQWRTHVGRGGADIGKRIAWGWEIYDCGLEIAHMIDDTVQIMDFGDGNEVYITGGHVDLREFIKRAGGVGSTWKYIPGQVVHGYLACDEDGQLMFAGQDEPLEGTSFPITCVVEPDNMPETFKTSNKIN